MTRVLANGFITPEEIGTYDVQAFYTCYHGEIGEPAYIDEIEDSLADVAYIHNEGDRWRGSDKTVYLSAGDEALVGSGQVRTVEVTESMTSLGYFYQVDGLSFFMPTFAPNIQIDTSRPLKTLNRR